MTDTSIKAKPTIRKKNIPKKGDFIRLTSTGRAAKISNYDGNIILGVCVEEVDDA